jgi:hypothetical protein
MGDEVFAYIVWQQQRHSSRCLIGVHLQESSSPHVFAISSLLFRAAALSSTRWFEVLNQNLRYLATRLWIRAVEVPVLRRWNCCGGPPNGR